MKNYALITGGSSGIGLAIAHQLGRRGYPLLLISNQPERLEQLKPELSDTYGVNVQTLSMDLARVEAAQEVFDFCENQQIEVEILVNNAGFYFSGEVIRADVQQASQMLILHNLTSTNLCTLFGQQMKERRYGYILNISSISAYRAFPTIAHYGSTKAYLKYFTQSLRTELKPFGVNVSALSPGATITDLYDPTVVNVNRGKKLGIFMLPEQVAKRGVDRLFANKAVTIPGFITRAMLYLSMLPPGVVLDILWRRRLRKMKNEELRIKNEMKRE